MALNVGVNVIEVDGRAGPAIQGAPTSVAAFLGMTERGVPNRAVRVSSMSQFRERFGNHGAGSYLAYAVEGFFLNGGREVYVGRVTGTDSVAASVSLNNRAAVPASSLRVTAGYRGQKDPGAWGMRLRVDVRDDPKGSTQLQADTTANAKAAQLKSPAGIRAGSVLRILSGGTTFYRKVKTVEPNNFVTWDGEIAPILTKDTPVSTAEFRLVLRYQPTPTSDFITVEEWRQLSMETDSPDYAVGRLNHPLSGSRYVVLQDLSGGGVSGEENPAVASNQALTGGGDGTTDVRNFIGDAAAKTGLAAFDAAQVQLLSVPDAHFMPTSADRISLVRAALDYCAARGDCMFVGTAPNRGGESESSYVNTVKEYAGQFQSAKVYGALYCGWIRVNDPAPGPAPTRVIPSDGHVLGVYARTEAERGIFKAPAGTAAQLRGAQGVSANFTDQQATDLIRNGFVNPIRFTPGFGITISASRTLSTDTRWRFVNVRLLFNYVKTSLRDGLRFVRQEPHSEELRRMVRFNVVTPFLLGLWRQGAFGSDPPKEVFTVKCDADNNPQAEVDRGNFKLEVYFYPVKPSETIIVVVGQQPSGSSAGEA